MRLANLMHKLFGERSVWTIIDKRTLMSTLGDIEVGYLYALRDQFGNVKFKKVLVND